MFPLVLPYPQVHPLEVAALFDGLATDVFIPVMYDDTIFVGELLYNYLAIEENATSGQIPPDWFGYSLPTEYTYGTIDYLPPASPSSSVTSPRATDSPFPFPPSPSPSPSQISSTPEYHQASPQPWSVTEPSCRRAVPVQNPIRGKWCCSACDTAFRGRWECERHIETIGKRVVCLACGSNLCGGREDSLRRHFKGHCKGDVTNFRFEDAFTEA